MGVLLATLVRLYDIQKRYDEAEKTAERAYQILSQALGEKHYLVATILDDEGLLYLHEGKDADSLTCFQKALDTFQKTVGKKHPKYAGSLRNLALLYLAQNKGDQSLKLAREAWQITRAHLDLTANVQSERQQLHMNESRRVYLNSFLSAAAAARAPAEEVYAEVLAWKGAVSLRQQQMRRLRRELIASDPQTARLYANLESATRRLAALINATPRSKNLEDYRRRLEEANAEVERCQQDLAAASAAFRKDLERRRRTPAQLRRVLPAGTALVDLVEYAAFVPQARGRQTWEQRLVAFVVRGDRPVERIELGPVETLAESIEDWRKSLFRRHQPVLGDDDPAVTLRRRLWEPLEPYLKEIPTVLISPDGVVARLPWGALPGSTPDKYLIEEQAMAVLAVPQFLPELLVAQKQEDADSPALLLVGDVDYGAAPGKADLAIASRGLATVLQRGGGVSWKRLPATRQEMTALHDLYRHCFPNGTAKVLEKEEATEAAVRAAAPRHRWLHLATHGYFAPQQVTAALERGKRQEEPALSPAEQRGFVGFPQGLLAGLVLAGANKGGGDGEDDGILTALEVAELDLRGCELAVLSACETGLGEKAGGEGLLGLQRAFQVAGARSVVASLWSVPDEATRRLMERFYVNLWQKRMGRLEALREAQRWLLADGSRDKRRTPPLHWAAFVLSGDWR